jgi:hypothetical protein
MCVIDKDDLELFELNRRAAAEQDPRKRARLERAAEKVAIRRDRRQQQTDFWKLATGAEA